MLRGLGVLTLLLLMVSVSPTFAQTGGAVEIEGGFAYKDMEFAVLHPYEVLGTMINKSGRNYKRACFLMKLYSKSDQLLKTITFCIQDCFDGQSKLFQTTTYVNPNQLKGYKILFSGGQ